MAALVTDGELNVLGDGVDVVIKPSDAALGRWATSSAACTRPRGCWTELDRRADHGRGRAAGARTTCASYVPEPGRAPLAGNTIGTDRAFLARDMPTLESPRALPQRRRVQHQGAGPALVTRAVYYRRPAKSGNHRALADIQESIEELRYYREAVFVAPPGPGQRHPARSWPRGTRAR